MPSWRHSAEKRRRSFNCASDAVRRLAVQARLWKMAPDEMDSRYETLLTRCASTERRLRVTTVSDVLAGISDTLQNTVTNSIPVHSPRFVPCDLVKDAPDDSLMPLEEEITIDSSQESEHGIVQELQGQSPALITLVSPSTTSLSSAAEASYRRDGRSSTERSHLRAEKRSTTQSESTTKKARRQSSLSTPTRREQRSRRLRRTPASYYPHMSWRRAHELVQTRTREGKRRRSPCPYRPLETNPGWTPLQTAIKQSGILTSPASLDFVFPDSSSDAVDDLTAERNHLDSGISSPRYQNQHDERQRPREPRVQRSTQEARYSSPDIRSDERECSSSATRIKTPPPSERTPPHTPEVIVTNRSSATHNSSPLARSISVFSDSPSPRRLSKNGIVNEDNDIDSWDGEAFPYGSPTGASTPICSAMELFLNAEPFVPRLPGILNDSTMSEVDDPSWSNCNDSSPSKFPVQETTTETHQKKTPPADPDSCISENNLDEMDESPEETSVLPVSTTITEPKDVQGSTQQYPIPVIEGGVVKPRNANTESNGMVTDSTQNEVVELEATKSHTTLARNKHTMSKTQHVDIVRSQVEVQHNGHAPRQAVNRTHGSNAQPQSGFGSGHVHSQNVAPIRHIQQQQPRQQIGGLCGIHRQQIQGVVAGVHIQSNKNGPLQRGALQQQILQNGQHNDAAVIYPAIREANRAASSQQWQQQQQLYQQQQQQQLQQLQQQQQQQQRQYGNIITLVGSQFQNSQTWGQQQQQQQQQQRHQIHAIQVHQLHQAQQQQYQQNLQQQQQLNYQQQQQQVAYRQQQILNVASTGAPINSFGTQQHVGFNNNNYGNHQQQQLQQPVRPKLPGHFNGGALSFNRQQYQATNTLGYNQPFGGANRLQSGQVWQERF